MLMKAIIVSRNTFKLEVGQFLSKHYHHMK